MKKSMGTVARILISLFVAGSAETGVLNIIQGKIGHNTTWDTSHGPYLVVGDVIVEKGVVLTIKPGTQVLFAPSNPQAKPYPVPSLKAKLTAPALVIEGSLVAVGSEQKAIYFTSPDPQGKGCLYFRGDAKGKSILRRCAISGEKMVCDGSFPTVTQCVVDGTAMGLDEDAYAMGYYFRHSL